MSESIRASDTLRRWFQVWDEGREEAIDEIFPAGRAHGLGPEPTVGAAAYKQFWRGFRETYHGIRIAVVDSVDEGEKCYVRCRATMTRKGLAVALDGGCEAIVRDGKIVECWNYWDFPSLFVQTGAMEPTAFGRMLTA